MTTKRKSRSGGRASAAAAATPNARPQQSHQHTQRGEVEIIARPGRPRVLRRHAKSIIGKLIDDFLNAGFAWVDLERDSGIAVKVLRRWYSQGEGPVIRSYLRAVEVLTGGVGLPAVKDPQPVDSRPVPGVAGSEPEVIS